MNWALDLGTTNTCLATWDEATQAPRLLELPAICRQPGGDDPLEAPRLVPSAVHLIERPSLMDRLGAWPPVARRFFVGRIAHIGRPALERNDGVAHPAFVPGFKLALMTAAARPVCRIGRRTITARGAAAAFLRELLRESARATGHRVRDLVVTSPVSAFELYRAEVQSILHTLGLRRVRFLDEPVAAALGYGLNLSTERTLLVVDIGGGTMHAILARLAPRGALAGEARILGKQGRPLGGNAVDGFVLADVCRQLAYPLAEEDDDTTRLWRRLMLAEACRVKEAVHFQGSAEFLLTPPGLGGESRDRGERASLDRAGLVRILDAAGFYRGLESALDGALEQAGMGPSDVDEVLLVGGSTLLPGVFERLEARFGRGRLRGWQPFEAVAFGAACYAAGRVAALDFIVHDYALVTHDPATGREQHTVIVPQGTRFPTPADLWKRQLVPTCALGEPESVFKLLVCEVARTADGAERRFVWDAAGGLHKTGGEGGGTGVVVPLNAASPTLGYLDPPHSPRDRRPRLEVAFGVNAERWLIATVRDLLTQRDLLREEPVVRLV